METLDRIAIESITPDEFSARYRSGEGRPVVISGALAGLPACGLEWITEQLPAGPLPARLFGKNHFDRPKSEWRQYAEIVELTPAKYASMLTSRDAHVNHVYMAQVPIGTTALASIIRPAIDNIAARTGLQAAIDLNLWWGPGGHTEPLHFDSGDGTLVQLYGTKRAVLFPPSQSRNLYPFPVRLKGIAPWISQVYVDRPDFEQFPRLQRALPHRIEVTISAGEVLFIPANWWHEVTAVSQDYICSINRFWKVAPLSRLCTNRITPVVYALSMAALAVAGKKFRPPPTKRESA